MALSKSGHPLVLAERGRGERLIAALVELRDGYAAADIGWSTEGALARPWTFLAGVIKATAHGWRVGPHDLREVGGADDSLTRSALHYAAWRQSPAGVREDYDAARAALRAGVSMRLASRDDPEGDEPAHPGRSAGGVARRFLRLNFDMTQPRRTI